MPEKPATVNHSRDGCGVTTHGAHHAAPGAGGPRDLTAAHTLQSALMADEAILMVGDQGLPLLHHQFTVGGTFGFHRPVLLIALEARGEPFFDDLQPMVVLLVPLGHIPKVRDVGQRGARSAGRSLPILGEVEPRDRRGVQAAHRDPAVGHAHPGDHEEAFMAPEELL